MARSYLYAENKIQVNQIPCLILLIDNLCPFFSREGALNLLRDFEGVSEWIIACAEVLPEHVEILAKHEVLRTCEGVGKILLRKPFEIISMVEPMSITPKRHQQSLNGDENPILYI